MIEQVREFIRACPFLEKYTDNDFAVVGVDYLGDEPATYSIEPTPANEWVKRYLGGRSGIKQFVFIFAGIQEYSQDENINMNNLKFYDDFSSWVSGQELPDKWISFDVSSAPALFGTDEGQKMARYQMQCRVVYIYYEE